MVQIEIFGVRLLQWLVCEFRFKWRLATLPQEHQVMGLMKKLISPFKTALVNILKLPLYIIRLDLNHVLKSLHFYLSCDSKWKFSCRWILQNALNGNLWNVWMRSQTIHLSTPSSRSLHICTTIIVLPSLVRCICFLSFFMFCVSSSLDLVMIRKSGK